MKHLSKGSFEPLEKPSRIGPHPISSLPQRPNGRGPEEPRGAHHDVPIRPRTSPRSLPFEKTDGRTPQQVGVGSSVGLGGLDPWGPTPSARWREVLCFGSLRGSREDRVVRVAGDRSVKSSSYARAKDGGPFKSVVSVPATLLGQIVGVAFWPHPVERM